jgi:hypothetical protein
VIPIIPRRRTGRTALGGATDVDVLSVNVLSVDVFSVDVFSVDVLSVGLIR